MSNDVQVSVKQSPALRMDTIIRIYDNAANSNISLSMFVWGWKIYLLRL